MIYHCKLILRSSQPTTRKDGRGRPRTARAPRAPLEACADDLVHGRTGSRTERRPRGSWFRRLWHRGVAATIAFAIGLSSYRGLAAGEGTVPPAVQAQLLAKVAGYDRGFRERAGQTARVVLLTKKGSAESQRVVNQLDAALRRESTIAGLPYEVTTLQFKDAPSLAKECKARQISV